MINRLTKIAFLGFVGASLLVFGILAVSAHAEQMPMQGGGSARGHFGPGPVQIPGVFGKVTAISGATLTVTSINRFNASSTSAGMTYLVNASNASILKNGTSSVLYDVAIGDMVMVQGTINGDSVAATKIFDGVPGMRMRGGSASGTFPGDWREYSSSTASSTGGSDDSNQQPHHGFFGGIMNFFVGIFGHFKF